MRHVFYQFLLKYIAFPRGIFFFLKVIGVISQKKSDKNLRCKKIIWLDEVIDEVTESFRISKGSISYSPKLFGRGPLNGKVILAEVKLYTLCNVTITARSSHFLKEEFVFIERIKEVDLSIANYSTAFVKAHNKHHAIVSECVDETIEEGFFLGGNGSWNYYHWMLEILPKIQFLSESGIKKDGLNILVNEVVKINPSFKVTLEKTLENFNVNFYFLDPLKQYKVSKLYHTVFVKLVVAITLLRTLNFNGISLRV